MKYVELWFIQAVLLRFMIWNYIVPDVYGVPIDVLKQVLTRRTLSQLTVDDALQRPNVNTGKDDLTRISKRE